MTAGLAIDLFLIMAAGLLGVFVVWDEARDYSRDIFNVEDEWGEPSLTPEDFGETR